MKTYMKFRGVRGFTLIELLLVIVILSILAAIAIVAINPAKQLGEAQNAQRRSDVRTILDAIIQYSIDNGGTLPSSIPTGTTCTSDGDVICKADTSCEGGASLDELITNRTYLTELPTDPTAVTSQATGYYVMKNSNGRVSVCAPTTYNSEDIAYTK